jgi:hypothetical protein
MLILSDGRYLYRYVLALTPCPRRRVVYAAHSAPERPTGHKKCDGGVVAAFWGNAMPYDDFGRIGLETEFLTALQRYGMDIAKVKEYAKRYGRSI